MDRTGRAVLVVLVVILAVVGTATAGSIPVPVHSDQVAPADTTHPETGLGVESTAPTTQTDDSLFQTDIDADAVEMVATLEESGDANWRVVYRLTLDTEDAVQGFEELAAEVEQNTSAYLGPFEERLRLTANTAEETTDRQMTVRNFNVTAGETVQPDTRFGEVVFEFQWDNFAAATDNDRIRAGAALDSLFLDERTSLAFRWGDSGQLESHTPDAATANEGRLTWRGPREFERGEPRAVVAFGDTETPSGTDNSTAGTDDATGGDGAPGDDTSQDDGASGTESEGESLPTLSLVVGGLILAALGAGLVVFLRQPRDEDETETPPDQQPDDKSAEETTDKDTSAETPPDELLSNEEHVLRLVDNHGGRIKQKKVADELDWSAARTSQVVSTLREEDRVETFRIGRENVLTLPDVDIVSEENGDEKEDDDDSQHENP